MALNRLLLVIATLGVGLLLSLPAAACQGPPPTDLREEAKAATAIFAFRLESAALQRTRDENGLFSETIVGQIKVVRVLKGSAASFTKIEYSSDACGGRRMDIGHYYLVFADESGDTIFVKFNDVSFFDITRFYSPSTNESPVFDEALKFSRGELPPEDFLGYSLLDPSRIFP